MSDTASTASGKSRHLGIDDPVGVLRATFAPAKAVTKLAAEQATTGYASLMAGTAAHLLRLAFGADADRAVFTNTPTETGEAIADLIAVYDATGVLVWYSTSDAYLFGSCAVHDRDLAEAYGGPANPVLDEDTKRAIEDAASIANAWTVGVLWFAHTSLRVREGGPHGGEYHPGDLFELIIGDELAHGEDTANSSTKIRYVGIEGITTEPMWRDLESALGLSPYGLGRFKEWAADRPKYLGPEVNLYEAIEWARERRLTHSIETHTTCRYAGRLRP